MGSGPGSKLRATCALLADVGKMTSKCIIFPRIMTYIHMYIPPFLTMFVQYAIGTCFYDGMTVFCVLKKML